MKISIPNGSKPVIVNFGCSGDARPGDINIDGSVTVILAKYLPLPAHFFGPMREKFVNTVREIGVHHATARGLQLPPNSVDGFYASHVLEHLDRDECRALLIKIHGWLKAAGVLRVVLPDLRMMAEQYVRREIDGDKFVDQMALAGKPGLFSLAYHKWMYDRESFRRLLEELGYRIIGAAEFGESRMPELAELDLPERRDESFYIEAAPS